MVRESTAVEALQPTRHVAVVACMDARLDVEDLLGLQTGEAHIIRNAGGVVTDDAIRLPHFSPLLLSTGRKRTGSVTKEAL